MGEPGPPTESCRARRARPHIEEISFARKDTTLVPAAETADLRNGATLAAFFYDVLNFALFPEAPRPTRAASRGREAEYGVSLSVGRQVRL